MNTEDKIKKCLKAAPKLPIPDGLLDKLQADVSAQDIKTHRSSLRRWFASANGSILPWRVAAAAVIAIAVLLPLSFGATKVVKKYFTTFEAKFEYPHDGGGVHAYGVGSGIGSSDPNFTEEDAHKAEREVYELYKQGKAKEVEPGIWEATLSDGSRIGGNIDPELFGRSEAEQKELLKKQFDEIHELRKAGKFERKFLRVIEIDGAKHKLYQDSFTLSDGKVIKMGGGEPVKNDNKD